MATEFNVEIKYDKSKKTSWAIITGKVEQRLLRLGTTGYRGDIIHSSNVKVIVSLRGYNYDRMEKVDNTSTFEGCRISMNGSTFLSFEDLEDLYSKIQQAKSVLKHLQGESSL